MRRIVLSLTLALLLVACADEQVDVEEAIVIDSANPTGDEPAGATPAPEPTEIDTAADTGIDAEKFPTVVDVTAAPTDGDSWRFDVTLSSPYDTPERYADAWRVLDADDNELGIRVLTHDHADEQPFTRSTTVEIPAGVDTVYVEGRDQANGWSGERFELTLDRQPG